MYVCMYSLSFPPSPIWSAAWILTGMRQRSASTYPCHPGLIPLICSGFEPLKLLLWSLKWDCQKEVWRIRYPAFAGCFHHLTCPICTAAGDGGYFKTPSFFDSASEQTSSLKAPVVSPNLLCGRQLPLLVRNDFWLFASCIQHPFQASCLSIPSPPWSLERWFPPTL